MYTKLLSPYKLYVSVKNKLSELKSYDKKIDYILFAGSGDPCIDSNLSREIFMLRELGYKIAVYTNTSLLWNYNVQENLMFADYVSLKIDTVNEDTWLKINRPHRRLRYDLILKGIEEFSKRYKGMLTTETTLIKNINDNEEEIKKLGDFFKIIKSKTSYFMKSIYPPAYNYAISIDAKSLSNVSKIINGNVANSVLLNGANNEELFITDDFENELLGLLAIHPIKEDAINNYAIKNQNVEKLNELLSNKIIKQIDFKGGKYFSLN